MKSNIIFFLAAAAISASQLVVPLAAADMGATASFIGLITGAYGFTAFLSHYFFGRASDEYGRRLFLRLGLVASALAFLLQVFASSPESLLLARAFAGFCTGIYPAALLAFVYESGRDIGKFSSYESLGWGTGYFLVGVIASYGGAFSLGAACYFLAFLVSLRMRDVGGGGLHVPLLPFGLLRRNLNVYLPFFLRHSGANLVWVIFPLFLRDLGASMFWIGVVGMMNVGTQFFFKRMVGGFGNSWLIRAGLFGSACGFIAYTLAPTYLWVIPGQLIISASWSALHVGSMRKLAEDNVERATALGALNSVINAGSIFGPLAGGVIAQALGFHAVMYAATVFSLLGLLFTDFKA